MIKLNEICIKEELKSLLVREHYRQRDLAEDLHVRESTVSNWLADSKRNIPADKLILIARSFNDLRFKRAVGNYLTEMPELFNKSNSYKYDPSALYIGSQKEESERKALDAATIKYFAERLEAISEDERQGIVRWAKEFSEEISTENSLLDEVIDVFHINTLEMEV